MDDLFAFLHVLPGKDERCGFTRRKESSVRQTFPTAELGVLAVKVLVLHKEDVQYLRTDMGHQGKHDNDPFFKIGVRLSRHRLHPAVSGRIHIL